MKLGKQPKRFGGPSAGFLARKAQSPGDLTVAADQDDLRIFLDDERPCPAGWTLVRTPAAFHELLDNGGADKVHCLALDWHLGAGHPNGEAIADHLAEQVAADPGAFPSLTLITLHSDDKQRAITMARTLELAFGDRDIALPEINVVVCSANETLELAEYLA